MVFLSGLGGHGIDKYSCADHDTDDWWSTVFTNNYYLKNTQEIAKDCDDLSANNDFDYGALIITVNNDENTAKAEFITTDDNIVDDPPPLPEEDEESFEETINEKTEVENKPNNSKKDLCSKKLEIAYKLMELYINNAAPRYDIEEFLEIFKKILKAF